MGLKKMRESKCVKSYIDLRIFAYSKFKMHPDSIVKKVKSTSSKSHKRASLVAQWLRICLPMQGTRVHALVWEDPTCRGATRPVSHNY